jgi:hypothetical protein
MPASESFFETFSAADVLIFRTCRDECGTAFPRRSTDWACAPLPRTLTLAALRDACFQKIKVCPKTSGWTSVLWPGRGGIGALIVRHL